jgi:hypothetical protein
VEERRGTDGGDGSGQGVPGEAHAGSVIAPRSLKEPVTRRRKRRVQGIPRPDPGSEGIPGDGRVKPGRGVTDFDQRRCRAAQPGYKHAALGLPEVELPGPGGRFRG